MTSGRPSTGLEPNEDWLALVDGRPVGLVQRSRVADYEENLRDFSSLVDVPDGALTIDYLLGDPAAYGKGLGSAMIAAFVVGRSTSSQTPQRFSCRSSPPTSRPGGRWRRQASGGSPRATSSRTTRSTNPSTTSCASTEPTEARGHTVIVA